MLTTPHLEAVPHGLAQGRVHVGDDGRGGHPQALGRLSHGRRQLLRLNSDSFLTNIVVTLGLSGIVILCLHSGYHQLIKGSDSLPAPWLQSADQG